MRTLMVVDGDNLIRGCKEYTNGEIDWVHLLNRLRNQAEGDVDAEFFVSISGKHEYERWRSVCEKTNFQMEGWDVDVTREDGHVRAYPDEVVINPKRIYRTKTIYDSYFIVSSDSDFWDIIKYLRSLGKDTTLASDPRRANPRWRTIANQFVDLRKLVGKV